MWEVGRKAVVPGIGQRVPAIYVHTRQDETDSGLDIDALKAVAEGVNAYKSQENGIILITHYQRLLDYIKPDFVHVMSKGQIVRSGGPEIALELEKEGYAFLDKS